jgi:hypothetical protein
VPLLCLCIYGQRRAVKMPYLCPIRGQGYPFCFFIRGRPPVRALGKRGFGSASFYWFRRKREWAKQGRKVFFFPCLVHLGEEERLQCRSKRHHFRLFPLFFNE